MNHPRRALFSKFRLAGIVGLWLAATAFVCADDHPGKPVHPAAARAFTTLHIPLLTRRPVIGDFLEMKPSGDLAGQMLKVDGFLQRDPKDGSPVSQKTEAYLGYTEKNLYVVCVCFDAEPGKIRARMGRRELINDDDQFGFVLDTFHDRYHGLFFYLNPMGIQQDGIWTDNGQEPDYSFDMVWNSEARLTGQGYVVWFEIPFKSLRFPPADLQHWGVFFERDIKRNSEYSFYPHLTSDAVGFLAQGTDMDGMANVTPGRNIQLIPYVVGRGFRQLDDRDPTNPYFEGKRLEVRPGLDAKFVIKNSFVLDTTINPDFSQVESDEPQITVNQRFEVLFPEKRPFFLENSSYFDTPINLVFTRRIADPEFGARLTGKSGPWSVGALFADDRSQGLSVTPYDPLAGHKAYFGVLRVNRDIGKESSVGLIYTDRELHTVPGEAQCIDNPCIVGANRVGGFDAKIKPDAKWLITVQGVESHTKFNDGTHKGGPAFDWFVERSSNKVEYNAQYQDNSASFETDTGFFRRPDIRRLSQFGLYRFRREGKVLQWHGPSIQTINNWDHSGTRLEWSANAVWRFVLSGSSNFGLYANAGHERLRNVDFDTIPTSQDYAHSQRGFFVNLAQFKPVQLGAEVNWGQATNYDTSFGPPVPAKANNIQFVATIRPVAGLTIDNTYLLTRLREENTNANIFNNHIMRTKWNYQFSRALSLRLIGQYNAVLSNYNADYPAMALSSLPPAKDFNVDVLLTYFVHPGTAVYVGYNSNLQNLAEPVGVDPAGNLLRAPGHFLNDGRQIFMKISYLFQY
jgi:Domain of unknown function (DUF5916)